MILWIPVVVFVLVVDAPVLRGGASVEGGWVMGGE